MAPRSVRTALASLLVAATLIGRPTTPAGAIELQPTTSVFLPNIVKMLGGPDGWNTPFIVQNVGTAVTDVTMDFYRFGDGALVKTRRVAGLAPGNSVFHSPNHDDELAAWGQYSVVVKSFGSSVVAVVNEHQNEGNAARQEALSYNGITQGSVHVYLPRVAALAQGWYCTVIAQSVGGPTSVVAEFRSFDGRPPVQISRSITAGGSKFIDPRFEPTLVAGLEYAVTMRATRPIGVVVNCHNDDPAVRAPRAYSYNGVEPTSEQTAVAPYAAKNVAGRTSRILVQNVGTMAAQPNLYLYPLGSTAYHGVSGPAALAPGAVWVYDAVQAPGSTAEWSVLVQGGQFALLVETVGPTSAMASTGRLESAGKLYAPNVTRTLGGPSGWTTPIVVQSQGAFAALLRWYRFADGALVHTQSVMFGRQGFWTAVKIDPRSVPQLADNTQYAVVIEGSMGGVGAVVLELNDRGGDSAMAYEAVMESPTGFVGAMGCRPNTAPSGSVVRCHLFGFPPGAAPVSETYINADGARTSREFNEPTASDGSWDVSIRGLRVGTATVSVSAGGTTQSVNYTITAPTFGVKIVKSTNGALWIETKPDAICWAEAHLPNGQLSTASQFRELRTAFGGLIGWNYPADTGTGTGTHYVECAYGSETHPAESEYALP